MGVFSIFNSAGAAASPVVGAGLAMWLNSRRRYVCVGTCWILSCRPHSMATAIATRARATSWIRRNALDRRRTPATFGAICLGFVQFYGLYTVHTLLPVMLTERLDLHEGSIGLLVSLLPFGVIGGTWVGGYLSDLRGMRFVLLLGGISMTVVYCALTVVSFLASLSTPVVLVAAIVFAFGLSVGFGTPAQLTIMVEFFPALRATAGSLQFFARFLGSAIAPILGGFLADQFGLAVGFGLATVLLLFSVSIGFFTITNPFASQ